MSPPNRPLAITRSSPEYNVYKMKQMQMQMHQYACVQNAKILLKKNITFNCQLCQIAGRHERVICMFWNVLASKSPALTP